MYRACMSGIRWSLVIICACTAVCAVKTVAINANTQASICFSGFRPLFRDNRAKYLRSLSFLTNAVNNEQKGTHLIKYDYLKSEINGIPPPYGYYGTSHNYYQQYNHIDRYNRGNFSQYQNNTLYPPGRGRIWPTQYRYNEPWGPVRSNFGRSFPRNFLGNRGYDFRGLAPITDVYDYVSPIPPLRYPSLPVDYAYGRTVDHGNRPQIAYERDIHFGGELSNDWVRFEKFNHIHWSADDSTNNDWPGTAKLKPGESYEGIIHRFMDTRFGTVLLADLRVEASIISVDMPEPYCNYELIKIFKPNHLSRFKVLDPLELDRLGRPKVTLSSDNRPIVYNIGDRVFGKMVFRKRRMIVLKLEDGVNYAQIFDPMGNNQVCDPDDIPEIFKREEPVEVEITGLPKYPQAVGYLVRLPNSRGSSRKRPIKWAKPIYIRPLEEKPKPNTLNITPKDSVEPPKPRIILSPIPSKDNPCTISEFANKIDANLRQIIKFLFLKTNTPIKSSHNLSPEIAKFVYNFVLGKDEYEVNEEVLDEEFEILKNSGTVKSEDRPPIVALLGHMGHGKTTLFNALCNIESDSTSVTQNIQAHRMYGDFPATLIDTPGLELFTGMRNSSIASSDLALILISADGGLSDQTIDSINMCKKNMVPFIIVVTKSDLASSTSTENIATQLADMDVLIEELGGTVQLIMVSLLKDREASIKSLIEAMILQSAAHPDKIQSKTVDGVLGDGYVLECGKSKGLGFYAYLILKNGSARKGNFIHSSSIYAKIRMIKDGEGKVVDVGNPSDVLYVYGFEKDDIPNPGDKFTIYSDEGNATILSEHNRDVLVESMIDKEVSTQIENALQELDSSEVKLTCTKYIPVVLKCPTKGLIEPVKAALESMQSVGIKHIAQYQVVHADIGNINLDDIQHFNGQKGLAIALCASINNTVNSKIKKLDVKAIKGDSVDKVLNEATLALDVLLGEQKLGECTGKAEILKIFGASKNRKAAGCVVTFGTIRPEFAARIVRGDVPIYYGKISSLRHTTDSATEILESESCGITFVDFNDFQVGDVVEMYVDE